MDMSPQHPEANDRDTEVTNLTGFTESSAGLAPITCFGPSAAVARARNCPSATSSPEPTQRSI